MDLRYQTDGQQRRPKRLLEKGLRQSAQQGQGSAKECKARVKAMQAEVVVVVLG
jgi:hypothetical protein